MSKDDKIAKMVKQRLDEAKKSSWKKIEADCLNISIKPFLGFNELLDDNISYGKLA